MSRRESCLFRHLEVGWAPAFSASAGIWRADDTNSEFHHTCRHFGESNHSLQPSTFCSRPEVGSARFLNRPLPCAEHWGWDEGKARGHSPRAEHVAAGRADSADAVESTNGVTGTGQNYLKDHLHCSVAY